MSYYLVCIVLCLLSSSIAAQPADLYERITDPLSIAKLDGPDNSPVKVISGAGWPKGNRDPADNFFILAQSDGAGVLSHIWLELKGFDNPDAYLKIWVDDELISSGKLYDFFLQPNSVFRPPFDTICSGSLLCNVQIPYKKNFRVTYLADWQYCCLVWGIEYRPIPDPSKVESFRIPPSPEYQAQQINAEKQYHKRGSPWDSTGATNINIVRSILPGDTAVLADIVGSGVFQSVHLIPSTIDSTTLRNLYIVMHWDHSVYPSVAVPLADFFGCGSGLRDLSSFYQYATKGGEFISYFPMPFVYRGKISIINHSASPVSFLGSVTYREQPIDRNNTGYFVALFNSSMPTTFGVHHRAGNLVGRGRYVGIHMAYPGFTEPYFLEGDPIFRVDSSDENSFRYTGIEEYSSGGWFFDKGPYSLPFSGCPEKWYSTYRFHVLAPYDFHKSFDLKLEHGLKNDNQVNIRSVSFFYKKWTPFWVSNDTIVVGNRIEVGGSGYAPHEDIIAKLGGDILFTTVADSSGSFSHSLIMPSLSVGEHLLSINEVFRPEPIFITAEPILTIIRDSIPYIYRYGERIHLRGNGFPVGKRISLFIDTVMIAASVEIDSDGQFDIYAPLPWIPSGSYRVAVHIDDQQTDIQSSEFDVSRTLIYEAEDLYPPFYAEDHAWKLYLSYHLDSTFSRRNGGFFGPQSQGKMIRYEFFVTVNDTFRIECAYAKGRQYGIYDIYIDSAFFERIDGYKQADNNFDISRVKTGNQQPIYFSIGRHTVEFRNVGMQSSAADRQLVFDNLVLTPTTAFDPNAAGTEVSRVEYVPMLSNDPVQLFPNPVRREKITVFISSEIGTYQSIISVNVIDIRGNTYISRSSIPQENVVELDVASLPNGVYFCTIAIQQDGRNRSYVSRFVIDR